MAERQRLSFGLFQYLLVKKIEENSENESENNKIQLILGMYNILELKRGKCFKKEGMPMSNAAKKLRKK